MSDSKSNKSQTPSLCPCASLQSTHSTPATGAATAVVDETNVRHNVAAERRTVAAAYRNAHRSNAPAQHHDAAIAGREGESVAQPPRERGAVGGVTRVVWETIEAMWTQMYMPGEAPSGDALLGDNVCSQEGRRTTPSSASSSPAVAQQQQQQQTCSSSSAFDGSLTSTTMEDVDSFHSCRSSSSASSVASGSGARRTAACVDGRSHGPREPSSIDMAAAGSSQRTLHPSRSARAQTGATAHAAPASPNANDGSSSRVDDILHENQDCSDVDEAPLPVPSARRRVHARRGLLVSPVTSTLFQGLPVPLAASEWRSPAAPAQARLGATSVLRSTVMHASDVDYVYGDLGSSLTTTTSNNGTGGAGSSRSGRLGLPESRRMSATLVSLHSRRDSAASESPPHTPPASPTPAPPTPALSPPRSVHAGRRSSDPVWVGVLSALQAEEAVARASIGATAYYEWWETVLPLAPNARG
ncbi:hypothetical protein NESM_000221600 [Novymonas esmeraldas]|uniref:Uncharacterized protein n=1 Tax=Novymonas esmeraldas TaxID=1808958 RepID=A0AAW0F4R1_9TRYP